jgi:hypothetical protein
MLGPLLRSRHDPVIENWPSRLWAGKPIVRQYTVRAGITKESPGVLVGTQKDGDISAQDEAGTSDHPEGRVLAREQPARLGPADPVARNRSAPVHPSSSAGREAIRDRTYARDWDERAQAGAA